LTKLNETPFAIDGVKLEDSSDVIERSPKIVFGQQAKYGQFPHFALIYINRPNAVVQCGAGLISVRWALSANHCVNS
jgi:secreted trypsin-like serine protease